MSRVTSLTAFSIPPPVQPAVSEVTLPAVNHEHKDDSKASNPKYGRPLVSVAVGNRMNSCSTSQLPSPPATATSPAINIPTPVERSNELKPATAPAAAASDAAGVTSPASSTNADSVKEELSPVSDTPARDAEVKAEAAAAPIDSGLKRALSNTAIDGSVSMSESHKKARQGKIFQCTGFGDCSMCFSRSEHLARHIRKHTGERPFQCKCGRAFSRLDNLRQHIYTVHASEPQNYQTIKQCLPVNIPDNKDDKRNVPVLSPQSMGPHNIVHGAPQPATPMGPHPIAAPLPPMVIPPSGTAVHPAQTTQSGQLSPPRHSQQPPLIRPMVAPPPVQQGPPQMQQSAPIPLGFQLPTPVKSGPSSPAQLPSVASLAAPHDPSSSDPRTPATQPPVQYIAPQGSGAPAPAPAPAPVPAPGQVPAFVYMSDPSQIYCVPHHFQIMPQYVPQYGYPLPPPPLAYPQGLVVKGVQPSASSPTSQAPSPQVSIAPSPR